MWERSRGDLWTYPVESSCWSLVRRFFGFRCGTVLKAGFIICSVLCGMRHETAEACLGDAKEDRAIGEADRLLRQDQCGAMSICVARLIYAANLYM